MQFILNQDDPRVNVAPLTHQLQYPPFFSRLGLAYNTSIKCVICLTCQWVIPKSQVEGHLIKWHKDQDNGIQITSQEIASALTSIDALEHLPELGYGPRDEVQGLKVQDGWLCSQCNKVYGEVSSIEKHYQSSHKGMPLPTTWQSVKAQQLSNANRKYFRITTCQPNEVASTSKIIEDLRAEQLALDGMPSGDRLDSRLLSPWLKSTRWLDLIAGKSIPDLICLASIPNDEDYPGLVAAVRALFLGYSSLFDDIPELALQRLNSPDPAKRYVHPHTS